MGFIVVYVTHADLAEAKKVAMHLLNKKLIACANFFPIESVYFWDGRLEEGKEAVSLLKCRSEDWNLIQEEISKVHPYVLPCMMKFDVEANADYERWIDMQTLRPH